MRASRRCSSSPATSVASNRALKADGVLAAIPRCRRTHDVQVVQRDRSGELVGFLKLDGASVGTVQVSLGKARTAARFGRSTKVYADRIAGDTLNVLSVDGVVALQGGRGRRVACAPRTSPPPTITV
jgi:uncharacterized protein GlcG (DUF336 family)